MSSKQIILKTEQVNLLLSVLKNANLVNKLNKFISNGLLKESGYETDRYLITLTDSEIEIVLNELTFYLTSYGLDKNVEVNKTGLKIEELIDLFY